MRSPSAPDREEQNLAYARRILTSGGSGTCKKQIPFEHELWFWKMQVSLQTNSTFRVPEFPFGFGFVFPGELIAFLRFCRNVINLSAQDKRFLNAISAT